MSLSAQGPASGALVWQRYAEPRLWSSWSPQIRSVTGTDERLHAGSTGTVHTLGGLRVGFVVDAWDDSNRTWSWTAWLGPAPLRLWHGVVETPDGVVTWLRVQGPLPILVGYAPLAQSALRRLVR